MKTMKRIDSRPRGVLGVAAVLASLAAAGVVAAVALADGPAPGTTDHHEHDGPARPTTVTKIMVCHKTHSKKHPQVTITISQSAWKAHLRHGDTLGACTAPTTTTTATGTTSDRDRDRVARRSATARAASRTASRGETARRTVTASRKLVIRWTHGRRG